MANRLEKYLTSIRPNHKMCICKRSGTLPSFLCFIKHYDISDKVNVENQKKKRKKVNKNKMNKTTYFFLYMLVTEIQHLHDEYNRHILFSEERFVIITKFYVDMLINNKDFSKFL